MSSNIKKIMIFGMGLAICMACTALQEQPLPVTQRVSSLTDTIAKEVVFSQGNVFQSKPALDVWYFIEKDVLEYAERIINKAPLEKAASKHDKDLEVAISDQRRAAELIRETLYRINQTADQTAQEKKKAFEFRVPYLSMARNAIQDSRNKLSKVTLPSYQEQANTIIPAQIEKLRTEAESIQNNEGFYFTAGFRQSALEARLRAINEKIIAISYIKNDKEPVILLCIALADALDNALTRLINDYGTALHFKEN
jgi:hypothetical protein